IFLCILDNFSASSIIPLCSKLITSALIGPSTISLISLTTSIKSLPSLAIRDGLVVTPQITPKSFASFISSILAVSIKKSHKKSSII
ncbi:hypothetical protein BM533_22340, partial [Clostridioides difficile]